ncbi:hypothetical protein Tco_1270946, partial [Tanacetum coccineum]
MDSLGIVKRRHAQSHALSLQHPTLPRTTSNSLTTHQHHLNSIQPVRLGMLPYSLISILAPVRNKSSKDLILPRNNGVGKFLEQCVGKASHAQTRGVPIPVTTTETGPSTGLKITVPSTAEEKICKKNDVKARSLLLIALPNEHQLTFNQYVDAQSMFDAIKARFGGNEATKKTQKALM